MNFARITKGKSVLVDHSTEKLLAQYVENYMSTMGL